MSQLTTFIRHFAEMCLSMCAGVALATFLLNGAALVGYGDLRERGPIASLLAIAVVITLPMAGWMRFRGMDWRPILEMSVVGVGFVLVTAALGVVSASAVEIGSVCGLACASMLVVMLARLDLYTGRRGHHEGHPPSRR